MYITTATQEDRILARRTFLKEEDIDAYHKEVHDSMVNMEDYLPKGYVVIFTQEVRYDTLVARKTDTLIIKR